MRGILDNLGFTTEELVAQNPLDDNGKPAVDVPVDDIEPDPDATEAVYQPGDEDQL